jgi:hypothetical protein
MANYGKPHEYRYSLLILFWVVACALIGCIYRMNAQVAAAASGN